MGISPRTPLACVIMLFICAMLHQALRALATVEQSRGSFRFLLGVHTPSTEMLRSRQVRG